MAAKTISTGWAIKYTPKNPSDSHDEEFLFGRYFFAARQSEHHRGYLIGVFKSRERARDWLTVYKARSRGSWSKAWCRKLSVVKVQVTVEEIE